MNECPKIMTVLLACGIEVSGRVTKIVFHYEKLYGHWGLFYASATVVVFAKQIAPVSKLTNNKTPYKFSF